MPDELDIIKRIAESKYKYAEEYCTALEKALKTEKIQDPVFVSADSWSSVEDVKRVRPDWTVWAVRGTEFDNLRQGNFTHKKLNQSPKEVKRLWEMLLLSELTMLNLSYYFVGTGTSNLWHLVRAMRQKENPEAITIDKKNK